MGKEGDNKLSKAAENTSKTVYGCLHPYAIIISLGVLGVGGLLLKTNNIPDRPAMSSPHTPEVTYPPGQLVEENPLPTPIPAAPSQGEIVMPPPIIEEPEDKRPSGPGGIFATDNNNSQDNTQSEEPPQPSIGVEKKHIDSCQGYPADINCQPSGCQIDRNVPLEVKASVDFIFSSNGWLLKRTGTIWEAEEICAEPIE